MIKKKKEVLMMLVFDQDKIYRTIDPIVENNPAYEEAEKDLKKAIENNNSMLIGDTVVTLLTFTKDAYYKAGFQDGIKFILKTLNGTQEIPFK